MKEKIFNIIIIIISSFILIQILIRKDIVYTSVLYALKMWVNNLIPAMFPFFIISDILINYKIIGYIPKIIKDICKSLFNISDNALMIFLISMLSGFPSNARNIRYLFDKNLITLEEANHILIFSHFANPVFILATVGGIFFNNRKIGIILLVSHYLSNYILGILFRKQSEPYSCGTYKADRSNKFEVIFISAINKALDTIITICGIITIFLLLSAIIINVFQFNNYNAMLVKCLFEITIGIEALSKLSIAIKYKAVIASMVLAFGGISVHFQVMSQLVNTKINYMFFLMGRMYQMIISGLITYFICLILKI